MPPVADPLPTEPRRAPIPFVGRLLEPLYAAAVARRNAAFDAGRNVERFADAAGRTIPVISIGNLSVGGTGKTPMVMHVLRLLLEHGHRPCVAMRGYSKSRTGAPDETDAYRRAFPDLPIVAQPDRSAGLRDLLAATPAAHHPDCIILDDGFQHRRIARDLDVVLIDATPGRSIFEDRLLPAGWLREPVASLRRAGAVIFTHSELAPASHLQQMHALVRARTPAPIAATRHAWTGLRQRVSGDSRMLPLDTLIGRQIVGCCAIGHPQAFADSLSHIARGGPGGSDRVSLLIFPDHDPLGPNRVKPLIAMARGLNADYIVVTDKDWSKLRHLPDSTWPCPILRPELAILFDSGREDFDRLLLKTVGNPSRST
jgi:tetraacyldisaccharide 4'-kinase